MERERKREREKKKDKRNLGRLYEKKVATSMVTTSIQVEEDVMRGPWPG